jgi:hypothetical protein
MAKFNTAEELRKLPHEELVGLCISHYRLSCARAWNFQAYRSAVRSQYQVVDQFAQSVIERDPEKACDLYEAEL